MDRHPQKSEEARPLPPYVPFDEFSGGIFLEAPSEHVVLLQAFFELSEGLGAVRTIDIRRSKIVVMLSRDAYADACSLLVSIQPLVAWRAGEPFPVLS